MSIEITIGIITGLASIVAVVTQVLKATPFPTERPKIVAFVLAFLAVGVAAYADNKFTVENAPVIATGVAAVSISAYGLYDVCKTAYSAVVKLVKKLIKKFKK